MTPHDEPRLTAYALGELPPADRPAVEAMLRDDPAARAYVDDVLASANRLRAALAAEPAPSLSEGQRHMLIHAPNPQRRVAILRYALAAMVLLSLGIVIGAIVPWPSGRVQRLALTEADQPFIINKLSVPAPSTTPPSAPEPITPTVRVGMDRGEPLRENAAAPASPPPLEAWDYAFNGGTATGEALADSEGIDSRLSPSPTASSSLGIEGPQRAYAQASEGWRGGVAYNDNHVAFKPKDKLTANNEYLRQLDSDGDGLEDSLLAAQASMGRPFGLGDAAIVAGEKLQAVDRFGTININPAPGDREAYDRIVDNPFLLALDNPLSTFSVDVDTASYANVRRFLLSENRLPPSDAVRIEELVNYFDYDYTAPADNAAPFAAHVEVAAAPWQTNHRLVRIGLKGYEVDHGQRGPANLVFLLDVSGSMDEPNKLPLVKEGMTRLVGELRGDDRVAIAVYAGASGLVLESTRVDDGKQKILDAINQLAPGGSTNGAAGIELAYQQAVVNFREDGVNRVILCTDGDFNVGITDRGQLTRLIEEKAKSRVYLSVLGFGTGNLQDATMEELSRKGDGNYAYIDSLREAEKVLVEQAGGTLVAIAKDVKLQVEFNPAKVAAYRLIGYENRVLAKEDFNDDLKDAGDIGSGHAVTALYEVVLTKPLRPVSEPGGAPVDALRYQRPASLTDAAQGTNELLMLKLRYKAPDAAKEQGTSRLIEFPVADSETAFDAASDDFRFAAAVAGFGMLLRDSPHKGAATFAAMAEIAKGTLGEDRGGYRAEFVDLVRKAESLTAGLAE